MSSALQGAVEFRAPGAACFSIRELSTPGCLLLSQPPGAHMLAASGV